MKIEDLLIKESNGKVILLNTTNFHWVRMSAKKFREETSTKQKKEEFSFYLDQRFGLLSEVEHQEEIRSVYFSVTGKCNLHCSFCTMNSGSYVSTEKDLTLIEIKNTVIPQLKKLNLNKIVVTGGEPLVRNDINDILYLFSEAFSRQKIVLQTNGLLLTPSFLKNNVDKIGVLEISIENIFENDLLQSKMERIFACANDLGIKLSLSFVVDESTEKYLFKGIDICHKYGAALTTRIVALVGRAREDEKAKDYSLNAYTYLKVQYDIIQYLIKHEYFDEMLTRNYMGELQPKRSCGAYGRILAIHPDGTTYMCGNFKDEKYSMGNIRQCSIEEINEDLMNKKQNEIYRNLFWVDRNNICKNCEYMYFCSGPCVAEIAENGDLLMEGEKCICSKLMFDYAIYHYEKQSSMEENLKHIAEYIKEIMDKQFPEYREISI